MVAGQTAEALAVAVVVRQLNQGVSFEDFDENK